MLAIVLGSAAGGGVPQWNCACDNCQAARRDDGVRRRTQDCVAVTADGRRWFLLNASPDIARQIEDTAKLWPAGARRHSPIAGVVLTNGDLDHCLGLLSLREWTPFSLYATAPTLAGLFEQNAMFRTLDRQRPHAVRRPLVLGDPVAPLLDSDAGAAVAVAGRCGLDRKREFARRVRALGASLTVNFVLHRGNLERLDQFIDLALELGADRVELAHTQYHGWAVLNRRTLSPSPAQIEAADRTVARAARRHAGVIELVYVTPEITAEAGSPDHGRPPGSSAGSTRGR